MVGSCLNWLRRALVEDRRGGVLIEFAMIVPIALFVMLAGVDVIRFAMLQQKLNRAATSMADLVSQYPTMSTTQLDQLFLALEHVITPFPLGPNGQAIVTSISKANAASPIVVSWQRFGPGSAPGVTSSFGVPGAVATLPAGFTVGDGENVIAAEVVYDFKPLLNTGILPDRRVTHSSFYRPRFGALTALAP